MIYIQVKYTDKNGEEWFADIVFFGQENKWKDLDQNIREVLQRRYNVTKYITIKEEEI